MGLILLSILVTIGILLIIPSGSSDKEMIPAPELAFSNSGTLANSPGYCFNHFF